MLNLPPLSIRLALAAVLALLPFPAGANVGAYVPNASTTGGVTLVTAANLPVTGTSTVTYRITNASNAADCDNVGGGSTMADCRWNGSNYEPIGVATTGLTNPLIGQLNAATFAISNPGLVDGRDVSADGAILDQGVVADTTPTLGGPLDVGKFALSDVGNVTQSPPVNLSSVLSPAHVQADDGTIYFNIDGVKNLLPDIFNTPAPGGGAQTSCSGASPCGDGYADSDGVTKAGKTKVYGRERVVVNLSETEAYGDGVYLIGGSDGDNIGRETYTRCTGGAQDEGDEGCQNLRNFVTDTYYGVAGLLDGTLSAGSGIASVNINTSTISVTESQLVGENKLAVFTTNASAGAVARDVNVIAIPPGTINAAEVETAGWSTGAKTWQITDGVVASSGVGGGWCIASDLAAFNDPNNVPQLEWLQITASGAGDGSMDTIETTTWVQGVNHGIPRGYRAENGTDKARIAPCALISQPTINNATKLATSISFNRPTGFDGTGANEDFVVSEYANQVLLGAQFHVSQVHGAGARATGVQSTNLLGNVYYAPGRYRGRNAFEANYSGDLGAMVDGSTEAWESGFRCMPGSCQWGFRYDYTDTVNTFNSYPFLIDFGNTDFSDGDQFTVLRVDDGSNANLTYDNNAVTNGCWGQNGDCFVRRSEYVIPLGDLDEIGSSTVGAACASGTCFEGAGTEDNLAVTGDFKVRLDADQATVPSGSSFIVQNGGGAVILAAAETTTTAPTTGTTYAFNLSVGSGTATSSFTTPALTGSTTVDVGTAASSTGTLRLWNYGSGNTGFVSLQAGTSGTTSYIFPNDDGEADYCLKKLNTTTGLKWEACSAAATGVTDGGAISYVTGTGDHFAIGGTDATSEFYFDLAGVLNINVPGGSIDIDAHPTNGGSISLKEGADDGNASWVIKAPSDGLVGTVSIEHTLATDGSLPHSVGALGINLASVTGIPSFSGAVTTITPPASGILTMLATPSAANVAAAFTGETGTGAPVFGTSPTITTPTISGTLTAGSATSLLLGTAGSAIGDIGFRNGTSGTITLAPVAGALGAVTLSMPAVTDTIATLAATQSLTNKTIDSEATGNVITIPEKVWFPVAGCNNVTASPFLDLPTANAAVAACVTGTNTQKGVLDFNDATDQSGQVIQVLPVDFTGAMDIRFKWLAASITGDVVWAAETICVADAETDDPAFNTASTVTDTAKGTTLQTNDASITGVTATGCAANEILHLRISRDANAAGDTMTGNARLVGFELTLRRAS